VKDKLMMERFGAWSGLIFLMIFGLGWLILARFIPPISPSLDADQVAAIFQERRTALLFASVIMMFSVLFLFPCFALLILIVHKIEQRIGMVTVMFALTCATAIVLNFYTPLNFSAAAFRPERSHEAILLASDLGFLQFMGGIPLFILMWFLMAYAVLWLSPKKDPILPRWFGYLNLWIGILYIPELLIYFFKTGPFAWDGLVGFWIPAILFTIYYLTIPFVCLPAIKRHF
jgi:hypothetical protein